MPKYMIRHTWANGLDVYLRKGDIIGEGAIVQFSTYRRAEVFKEHMDLAIAAGESISIVPYDPMKERY